MTEHLLPIFQNLWYENAYYQYKDSCGVSYYTYSTFVLSPVDLFDNNLPDNPECAWNYSSITNFDNSTAGPSGFISDNYDDWCQIILDPNAALTSYYKIDCQDENGTNAEPTKIGIFLDPLYGENSFVTQTVYWGSRYAPLSMSRLSLTLASQVIQAGIDQQQYTFVYTLSPFYYPGGTEEHPNNCKFRCDSFVYYCYDVGAQIKIQPDFSLTTFPLTIFNDFTYSADPVEYAPVCNDTCYPNTVSKKTKSALLANSILDTRQGENIRNTTTLLMEPTTQFFQKAKKTTHFNLRTEIKP